MKSITKRTFISSRLDYHYTKVYTTLDDWTAPVIEETRGEGNKVFSDDEVSASDESRVVALVAAVTDDGIIQRWGKGAAAAWESWKQYIRFCGVNGYRPQVNADGPGELQLLEARGRCGNESQEGHEAAIPAPRDRAA
ncbi:hypothetical protein E2C01_024215 [Portunus trituberculatus]|uniref:Uncharacterized protein n=1 Tax=Portunus trituberculatus TaxID=210409 RepID=A0A5B7ED86_PORTR|nr:hypothetical protein [Portunus trituberculatus]